MSDSTDLAGGSSSGPTLLYLMKQVELAVREGIDEQRVLLRALMDESDETISDALVISHDAVKKTWRRIHDRVVDRQQHGVGRRANGCRARNIVDQRNLAEPVTTNELADVLAVLVHHQLSRDNNVVLVAELALRHNDGSRGRFDPPRLPRNRLEGRARQRTERALAMERCFVATTLDSIPALVVVLDTAGRVIRFNQPCAQLTGLDPTDSAVVSVCRWAVVRSSGFVVCRTMSRTAVFCANWSFSCAIVSPVNAEWTPGITLTGSVLGFAMTMSMAVPRGTAAVIELGSWPKMPIFEHLQKLGNVSQDEMLRTFNMGIGMLLVINPKKFKKTQTLLERAGEKYHTVGRIVKGERKVTYT